VKEVPMIMIAPLFLLVSIIVFIGFFPAPVIVGVSSVLKNFSNLNMDPSYLQNAIASLREVSMANAVLVGVLVVVFAIRYWQQKHVTVSHGPTWGCGYSAGDARHQYTPTSYADSIRQVAEPFISFQRHYKSIKETEIFPEPRTFHTESEDKIEQSGVKQVIQLLVKYLPFIGFAQTGQIRHYLIYPLAFIVIMGLLTFLNYL
jgi:NADH:ubiquinone oxidoreductase subunit 5 (subunit L)/multisubunit Na+/H+ antiporter MnhA subunit